MAAGKPASPRMTPEFAPARRFGITWLSAAVGIPNDPDKEFECNWLHSNCGRLLKIGQLWILLAIVRLLRSLQHAATFLV
jgi:hypothetical protein